MALTLELQSALVQVINLEKEVEHLREEVAKHEAYRHRIQATSGWLKLLCDQAQVREFCVGITGLYLKCHPER